MKTIASLLLVAAIVCGCAASGPKRVSAAEFKRQYAQVGMVQTMHAHNYLGERDGRAYLRVGSMSTLSRKWSDRIFYVELSNLDAEFRESLPRKEMKEPL